MSSNHDREQPGSAGEDAAVTRAWQHASDEQPPARLDAGILAAAHRSVQDDEAAAKTVPVPPRARSRWMKWQPLAAAATVAGLAFVLVQTVPREREVAPPIRIEAPTPNTVRDRGAESTSRSPAAEVTADVADALRDARIDERKGVMTEASGDASAEAAAPAEARALGALPAPSTADWAVRIEALHASGDLADAADVLRAFRATDPDADAHLPESLLEWARTVE
jgi:hypothetical protein